MLSQFPRLIQLIGKIPFIQQGYHARPRPTVRTPGSALSRIAARSIAPIADKASDEPTLDLLTQRMQVHEKTAWMLRSLLEA